MQVLRFVLGDRPSGINGRILPMRFFFKKIKRDWQDGEYWTLLQGNKDPFAGQIHGQYFKTHETHGFL
jgi:hypothetical protein